jgi:hypothetical protein
MTTAQDGGKVVSLMHRPPLPAGNTPDTHFGCTSVCYVICTLPVLLNNAIFFIQTQSCLIAEYGCSFDTNKNGPHHKFMEVGGDLHIPAGWPQLPLWMMLEKRKISVARAGSRSRGCPTVSVLPIPTTLSQFKIINKYIAFHGVYKSAT